MPSNQIFGRTVRQRFDLHDLLHVAEMMRTARLFGHRPEIYRAVGWRTLVELASQATPEEQRQEFEARILAGERVDSAEIIRARCANGRADTRAGRPGSGGEGRP
jgi:antitoxin component of MazEF toxin-antitoxin module